MLVNRFFPVESLSLFFLVGVLAVASRFGLWPSIYASVLAFLGYNFFLTEPYFTFEIANQDVVLTLLLFLAVAIVTGNLAARLRDQALAQRAIAKRTANLFDFSRKVASVASLDDVVWAAVTHVASTMQCSSLILMPDASGRLTIVGGMPPEDHLEPRDRGAAEWAWDKHEPAGWSSSTLPSASWFFLPMKSAKRVHGLLGVQFGTRQYITTEERRLLDSLVDQVGIAIERTQLAADMEQSRLLAETESLRAALLSSVSHDLRTPLVSIIGAATSLVDADEALGPTGRRAMAETIRDEGERLNRYVQNLLDMTRLGYGALKVAREPVDLREVVGRALRRLERDLAGHRVVRRPAGLACRRCTGDAVLLEQVVTNILDNAAKYAPPGSRRVGLGDRERTAWSAWRSRTKARAYRSRTARASSTCSSASARAMASRAAPGWASPSPRASSTPMAGQSAQRLQPRTAAERVSSSACPLSPAVRRRENEYRTYPSGGG